MSLYFLLTSQWGLHGDQPLLYLVPLILFNDCCIFKSSLIWPEHRLVLASFSQWLDTKVRLPVFNTKLLQMRLTTYNEHLSLSFYKTLHCTNSKSQENIRNNSIVFLSFLINWRQHFCLGTHLSPKYQLYKPNKTTTWKQRQIHILYNSI